MLNCSCFSANGVVRLGELVAEQFNLCFFLN